MFFFRNPWFLTLLIFMTACHSDKNALSPQLHFKSLKEGDAIWNTAEIEMVVPAQESTSRIDLYTNGNLISTSSKSPFTLSWNTQSIEDGSHTLRAVWISKEGATQESSITISVKNTLASFTVKPGHLTVSYGILNKGWVFINENGGRLIAVAEIKNGETYQLRNADFNGNSFVLSEAYLTDGGSSLNVVSVSQVSRGKWTLAEPDPTPPAAGNLDWAFQDKSNFRPFFASSAGDSQLFYDPINAFQLTPTQSLSKLFIREIGQDINHYQLTEGLAINQAYAGSFTDINKALSIEQVDVPGTSRAGVRLYGFPRVGDYAESYVLGVFNQYQSKLIVEYPGTDFPAYGSENLYQGNGFRLNSFNPTRKHDLSPFQADIIINAAGERPFVATSGKFDLCVTGLGYATQFISFDWSFLTGASGAYVVTAPEFPGVIRDSGIRFFDVTKLTFNKAVQVVDFGEIESYEAFVSFIRNNGYNAPYEFGRSWKEETFTSSGFTNTGRLVSDSIPTVRRRLSAHH